MTTRAMRWWDIEDVVAVLEQPGLGVTPVALDRCARDAECPRRILLYLIFSAHHLHTHCATQQRRH